MYVVAFVVTSANFDIRCAKGNHAVDLEVFHSMKPVSPCARQDGCGLSWNTLGHGASDLARDPKCGCMIVMM
jgi:hypothetical protein